MSYLHLTAIFPGGMQQVDHVVNAGSIMHGHYTDNVAWVNTPRPKFMHAKGKILNPAEAEDGNKHLHVPINGLPNSVRPSGLNNGSSCLISFKAAANNVLGGGKSYHVSFIMASHFCYMYLRLSVT